MPELPNSRYLRRGKIRAYLGIDDKEFSTLVDAGVLKPYYFQGKGRAYYRLAELLQAEADNKIFKPIKESKK